MCGAFEGATTDGPTGGATTSGHRHEPHRHHGSAISRDTDRRWLTIALALLVTFLGAEVVIGLLARSLALLTDAAHMLTDAAAIGLAIIAMRLSGRRPAGGYTYGLKRAEILSAHINGLTLLLLALWLGIEAVQRLLHPLAVDGVAVLVTALVGTAVNILVISAMRRANRESLNIRGAYLHVLTDLVAFVTTAVAGLVVAATGFTRADALASLVVVALMIKAGVDLVRESVRIFLEAAPAGVDPPAVAARLACLTGVVEVHDLHVWQITSGHPALSAHVLVTEECDCHAVRDGAATMLREAYGIGHTTLQVDHVGDRTTPPAGRCGATATVDQWSGDPITSSADAAAVPQSASSVMTGQPGPPGVPEPAGPTPAPAAEPTELTEPAALAGLVGRAARAGRAAQDGPEEQAEGQLRSGSIVSLPLRTQ